MYVADGETVLWTYDFDLMDATTIQVWVKLPTEIVATQLDSELYDINTETQTVEFPIQPAIALEAGSTITIIRVLDLVQLRELVNQGRLQADRIEDMVDYLTLITQQLAEIQSRTPTVPIGQVSDSDDVLADLYELLDQVTALVAEGAAQVEANEALYQLVLEALAAAEAAAERAESAAEIVETGVPSGGTTGQVLTKDSDETNDFSWQNVDAPTVVEFNAALDLKADQVDLEAIQSLVNEQVSVVGQVVPFAMSTAPEGWLLCDGASYLRADYDELFAVIGTSYGSVDATHFNVPDLRGIFVRGRDTRAVGSGTDPDSPRDWYTTQGFAQQNTVGAFRIRRGSGNELVLETTGAMSISTVTGTTTAGTWYGISNQGSSTITLDASTQDGFIVADEVRPINMAMNYCIRTVQGTEVIDTSDTLAEIQALVDQAEQAVEDTQTIADTVETSVTTGLTSIETARSTAVTSVNTARATAINLIQTAQSTGVSAVTSATSTGVSEIEDAVSSNISTIEGYATAAAASATSASDSADRAEAAAELAESGLPLGGTTGQVLAKASAADLDVEWVDDSTTLLSGGTTGQFLTKTSGTELDIAWSTAYTVPTGGTTGYVLEKASAADGDTSWLDIDTKISTAILANAIVQSFAAVGGATSLNAANGEVFSILSVTADTTFTMTASVTTGYAQVLTLFITNGGAFTLTFTDTTWDGGSQPTFLTDGIDVITLVTIDGGVSWYGVLSASFF